MHLVPRNTSADIHFIHIACLLQQLQMILLSNGVILASEQCRVASHTDGFTILREEIACRAAEDYKQQKQQDTLITTTFACIYLVK